MRTPFISVVVPVYNAAPWLPAALASLCGQTFTDFEAVLVDDGSTDDSAALCADFCRREPRFALIRQANAGPSEARLQKRILRLLKILKHYARRKFLCLVSD